MAICLLMLGLISASQGQISPTSINVETYSGAVSSVTVTMPSGSSVGDVIFVSIATDDDGAIAEPAEFTQIYEFWHNGDGPALGVFYRVIDGTEAATYNFTFPSEPAVVSTFRYAGLDPLSPIQVMANMTGLTNAPTAPSVTTSKDNVTYLHFVAVDQRNADASNGPLIVNSVTADTVMFDQSNEGFGHVETGIFAELQTSAGATPVGSFGWGNNQSWSAATLALNPGTVLNVACDNNSTIFDGSDDFISFDLKPINGSGTYTVTSTAGTVTPSMGTYGVLSSHTLPNGSAGGGSVILTIEDNTTSAQTTESVTDPDMCLPEDCGGVDWNLPANKAMITATQSTNSNSDPQLMLDSDPGTAFVFVNNTIVGLDLPKFQFPSPAKIFAMEFQAVGTVFDAGSTVIIEASNDDAAWTALTATMPFGTLTPGTLGGNTANVYRYEFLDNDTEYLYYRLRGVTGGTRFSDDFVEAYFQYDIYDNNVTNVGCADNGTPTNFTDDLLTFDLNPGPGSGTYMVAVDGGFTVTPSIASYGSAISFSVSAGSSGSGDITLTVQDATVPCVQQELIVNSMNFCLDTDLDGVQDITDMDDDNDGIVDSVENFFCNIDYNVTANKQYLSISATASTSGNIQVLLDGNVGNNSFFYPDVSIADKEVIRIEFPKPTILTGIEYEIGNSYMFNTGATTVMQGSDDGSNWTDVSSQYVMERPPNNTPGVLSSAPFAQTFLWSNTTPYLYYRLYGISGNTNQNPWINELHFRTSYHCDYDDDGLVNSLDLDADNDGIPDNVEGQPTLTYTGPNADTPTQYMMQNGINSAYGNGLSTVNSDTDPCADFLDEDSDDDGISDKDESGINFNGVPGMNGLDSGSETTDDYTDINGDIDSPGDLQKSSPTSLEVDYRSMALRGRALAMQVTCNGPIANGDGKIVLDTSGITPYKVGGSMGTIYSGPDFASATDGTTVPLDVISNLANPDFTTFYTIRLYDSETVFEDYVAQLEPKVCAKAELSVAMTPVIDSVFVGEQKTYQVTLTNAGPDPGVDVNVKVEIPPGLEYITASPTTGTYSPGTELWTLDQVPVGAETLTITYKLK